MFTHEELKALFELINRAQLQGKEAVPVANLQQKLMTLIKESEPKAVEVVEPKAE